MSNRTYNHKSLVWLFKQVTKELGAFDPSTWAQLPNVKLGHSMTLDEVDKCFEKIYSKYVVKFTDLNRPKSRNALKQQVQWATTTQANQTTNITRKNRLYAYEAGFMTISDIIKLESIGMLK